jgi:hypothetical protein
VGAGRGECCAPHFFTLNCSLLQINDLHPRARPLGVSAL